jgi:Lon protease-like protein
MTELPLFPLSTVLFPGMPLKLHIFEERYKQMINECIDNNLPFGVLLIESGEDTAPLVKPHLVGCTAHITQVQRLPFGRMNILAMGRDRFRVNALSQNKPYLSGDVEYVPLKTGEPLRCRVEANRLNVLLKKYLATLENAGQLNFNEATLPDEPLSLAYTAAIILQTELETRQKLLASESLLEMLQSLTALYYREVTLLQIMLTTIDITNGETPFSLN